MKIYSFFLILSFSNLFLTQSFRKFSNDRPYKDIYRYRSIARRNYKDKMKYTGYVQDHHCIPKQWKEHPLLQDLDYDINSSKNLIIMPNNKGIEKLNLHPNTLVHDGGHVPFNKYIKHELDYIHGKWEFDEKKYLFWLFLCYIKKNMKFNDDQLPWK